MAGGNCEACGAGPMLTLMLAARKLGADKAHVLHYANSGDVSGDRSGVVGYMAAVLYGDDGKEEGDREETRKVGVDLGLSPEEKKTLHEIAYQAIRSRCLGEPMPEIPAVSPKLNENRGAFVCLHKEGELRGCIGMIEGREPLHKTIRKMAVQAAFADPRFCALDRGELDRIDIELSVLTPLERIDDPEGIEIGKHGLVCAQGGLFRAAVAPGGGGARLGTSRVPGMDLQEGGPAAERMEGPGHRNLRVLGRCVLTDRRGSSRAVASVRALRYSSKEMVWQRYWSWTNIAGEWRQEGDSWRGTAGFRNPSAARPARRI